MSFRYNQPIFKVGLKKGKKLSHEIIYITGMTCINCQNRIQTTLKAQDGITNATVSYQLQTAEIDYDPNEIPLEQILSELGLIAALYFLLQYFGILNRLAPNSLATDQMGYGMLFVIGLITSVHCIAMCGGINLSQVLQKTNDTHISRSMFQNALSYQLQRMVCCPVDAIHGQFWMMIEPSPTMKFRFPMMF